MASYYDDCVYKSEEEEWIGSGNEDGGDECVDTSNPANQFYYDNPSVNPVSSSIRDQVSVGTPAVKLPCRFGNNCRRPEGTCYYSHPRDAAPAAPAAPAVAPANRKVVCWYDATESCTNPRCPFNHPISESSIALAQQLSFQ
jgi:hypothetical protein